MTGLTNWLGILGTGGYWFGFLVTAAFRYLLALARRFGFEGFGIRAAIHANPELLSNVRALLCAQSILILILYSPATPTRRAILFLTLLTVISFGLHPSVQHSSCDTEAKA